MPGPPGCPRTCALPYSRRDLHAAGAPDQHEDRPALDPREPFWDFTQFYPGSTWLTPRPPGLGTRRRGHRQSSDPRFPAPEPEPRAGTPYSLITRGTENRAFPFATSDTQSQQLALLQETPANQRQLPQAGYRQNRLPELVVSRLR